jgi:hypothetical protein
MPTLTGLWLFPMLAITWVFHKPIFIWAAIILFMLLYGFLYVVVPNVQKKNIKWSAINN